MKKKSAPRHDLFAKEYLVDLNATKAAERAGFSKKTAYSQGQRLLKNVEVQKQVQKLIAERSERIRITADRVLEELAIIGFSDIKNHLTIEEGGGIQAKTFEEMGIESRALESVQEDRVIKEDADGEKTTVYDKVKFKLHPKLGALELLGKHLLMFPNKIEAPDLENALNRHSMSIDRLQKSLAEYKKAKTR